MYAYVVNHPFHSPNGTMLNRGDVLTGEDARWLECDTEESRAALQRCGRIHAAKIDATGDNVIPTGLGG